MRICRGLLLSIGVGFRRGDLLSGSPAAAGKKECAAAYVEGANGQEATAPSRRRASS
jgi:hypothetical protein